MNEDKEYWIAFYVMAAFPFIFFATAAIRDWWKTVSSKIYSPTKSEQDRR